MELREFVEKVLADIVAGVKQAQKTTTDTGAAIVYDASSDTLVQAGLTPLQAVNFDVALTSTDSKTSKGGVGVFLGHVGLGGQKETADEKVS